MRKLAPSIDDDRNNCWTYELPNGQRIKVDRRAVREHGLEAIAREFGLDLGDPSARLPVYQRGEKIGTVPANFDPDCAESSSPLFSVRPGDFRREGDGWTACPSLGPGDLGSLVGFEGDQPERYRPAELTKDEEAMFAEGHVGAGMEALLGRMLGR